MTNNFKEQLEYSHQASHEPFWDAVYKKAFPEMDWHKVCIDNGGGQMQGIDRIVYLKTGKILKIDEKKRTKEYSDILLEYKSNDKTGAKGWIRKDLTIDYLAYAFMKSRRVYFFNWPMLRRAWNKHREEWREKANNKQDGYRIVPAKNDGYTTWSIAVPIPDLLEAHANAFIIDA